MTADITPIAPDGDVTGRRLLKPEEAWTYLGISKPKLYELTRDGHLSYIDLPARTEGGKGDRRYELTELERFIAEHRTAVSQ